MEIQDMAPKQQRIPSSARFARTAEIKSFHHAMSARDCGDEAKELYTFSGKGEVLSYTTIYEVPSGYDAKRALHSGNRQTARKDP